MKSLRNILCIASCVLILGAMGAPSPAAVVNVDMQLLVAFGFAQNCVFRPWVFVVPLEGICVARAASTAQAHANRAGHTIELGHLPLNL